MCGLEIQVADGKVAGIRGNREDTWSAGHICPKGATLGAVHQDPDRIRQPMIKVDGEWQEVTWDAAFRRCTELLAPVIEKYGIGAVTRLHRNPLAHSFSLARLRRCAAWMSGMPMTYSPGTIDQWSMMPITSAGNSGPGTPRLAPSTTSRSVRWMSGTGTATSRRTSGATEQFSAIDRWCRASRSSASRHPAAHRRNAPARTNARAVPV